MVRSIEVYNFVETLRKFTIATILIRKLKFSSYIIISTDEDPSLRMESFAIKNLRGVSSKLYLIINT